MDSFNAITTIGVGDIDGGGLPYTGLVVAFVIVGLAVITMSVSLYILLYILLHILLYVALHDFALLHLALLLDHPGASIWRALR